MKKQRKLFMSGFSFLLAITFFVMGVQGALTKNIWNVSGKVSFEVEDISGKFGVYEGRFLENEGQKLFAYYNLGTVQEKDFEDTSQEDWLLSEEHATFTRIIQNYFYQVVIRNTDNARMFVYFEVHKSLFDNTLPVWLNASSFVFVHANESQDILKAGISLTEYENSASKFFKHDGLNQETSFPTEIATDYNESELNYLGEGANSQYRKFSLKLEGGQTLSLVNVFFADLVNATAESKNEEFLISNAIKIDLEEPIL